MGRIFQDRNYAQLIRWSVLSGQVTVLQIVVQAINAITGLLLVRYLPKDEYAWFTLSSSLLATLNILSDGGIATGLMSVGGRIYNQKNHFARLLLDGLYITRWLIGLALLLVIPLFYLLFVNVDTPRSLTIAALFLAALAVWPSMSTTLLNVANRLHTRVQAIQFAEILAGTVRLGLTALMLLSGWMTMLAALATTVITCWSQALIVRRQTQCFIQSPSETASYRPEIRGFVRSLYLNHIFFCFQAQITLWIIGWMAGTSEVADLGALSRLGILFVALIAPVNHLAVPAIARIQDIKVLRKRFILVFLVPLFITGSIVAIAVWQPTPFLWILGSNYNHLTTELPLALCAQGVSFIAALAWGLILARGWVQHAWLIIITTVIGFIIGAACFQLGTVTGILYFNMISVVPTMVLCAVIIFHKLSVNIIDSK